MNFLILVLAELQTRIQQLRINAYLFDLLFLLVFLCLFCLLLLRLFDFDALLVYFLDIHWFH